MDQERMSSPKKQTQCGKMALLVTAALVLCTLFSSVAMVMSALTFYNNYSNTESVDMVDDDLVWEEETLSELETMLESNGLMSFSNHRHNKTHPYVAAETERVKRDTREVLDDLCDSTKTSNYSDALPSAHIVVSKTEKGPQVSAIGGEKSRQTLHREAYVVISKNWTCGSTNKKDSAYGIISGGMVFNRSSGFLTLPKDGVYYVYSHVEFKLQGTEKTYEAHARMVVCIPGETCQMNAYNYHKLSESGGTVSQPNDRPTSQGEHGLYQGGLFHFPAGTRILILAKDPKFKTRITVKRGGDKLVINSDSYMGAYLVQEMDHVF